MDQGLILLISTAIFFALAGIIYSRKKISIEQYLTARKTLGLGAATATLVASGMGAWILFSPAEATVTAGILALAGYALGSALAFAAFIWLGSRARKLAPEGHGITELVYHRYGKATYLIVLCISLFYMAVYLSAELSGMAMAMDMIYGVPALITAVTIGAGTVAYTAIGGLKASIFTDRIQSWFIFPLLAAAAISSVYLLKGSAFDAFKTQPEMLLPSIGGLEYALTLIIAIVGAELFNQGNWQRVYSPKTTTILKRSFFLSAIIVVPIILMAGSFGIFALSTGTAEQPSVALFAFIRDMAPPWLTMIVMILGVSLVMSSMDSLVNGMVSVFTIDARRLFPDIRRKNLTFFARSMTVLIAILAVYVATKGYSVLYLFLLADLVCVAAAFPVFFGIYARRFSGKTAAIAIIAGIISGAIFFPDPSFTRGSLLWSFVVALLIPAGMSMVIPDRKYDFSKLKSRIKMIGDRNER